MRQRDPYEVLGIGADATCADITRAWRRVARAMHPDSRPGDPAAGAEFQAVSDAYGLLSDPARRAAYDHQHQARPGLARRIGGRASPGWAGAMAVPPSRRARTDARPGARRGLQAGPVRIEPPGPPGPGGSSGPEPPGSPAILALLTYWLLADPRERPW